MAVYYGKNHLRTYQLGRSLGKGGDDGIVALYTDGTYEMITKRHKGEEANSVIPLRESTSWQFGKAPKEVASAVLMTDGVLDYCVGTEKMHNRVYYPFLEPALTTVMETDEAAMEQKAEWEKYLSGKGDYPENFRKKVTDDISFVVIQNPDAVKQLPEISFDMDAWDRETAARRKEIDDALYADYKLYKSGKYTGRVEPGKGILGKLRARHTKQCHSDSV